MPSWQTPTFMSAVIKPPSLRLGVLPPLPLLLPVPDTEPVPLPPLPVPLLPPLPGPAVFTLAQANIARQPNEVRARTERMPGRESNLCDITKL